MNLYTPPTQPVLPVRPLLAALALALSQGAAQANVAAEAAELSDLARGHGCFSCHSAKEKIVGPAFASVAQKYAGQKDAAAELAQSISQGSVRKWGRIAMPAHGSLPAADVKRLAEWVLRTPQ